MPIPAIAAMAAGQAASSFGNGVLNSFSGNAASSFGSSVGSGLGNVLFGGISARRQWKYAKKQMALQQQYALEQMERQYGYMLENSKALFDYQNEYNEPSKVFDRFRLAGINPAAALGASGASIGATIGSPPSGSAGVSAPSGGGNFSSTPLASGTFSPASFLVKSQMDNIDADTNKKNAEAENIRNSTHEQGYQKRYDDIMLDIRSKEGKILDSQIDIEKAAATLAQHDVTVSEWTLGARIDSVLATYQSILEDCKQNKIKTPYLQAQLKADLALSWAHVVATKSQGRYFSELANLTQQQVIDLKNEIARNWDKRFKVGIRDPHTGEERIEEWSLNDYFDNIIKNNSRASSYDPASAEFDMKNKKNFWKIELGKALIGLASNVGGASIIGKSAASRKATGQVSSHEVYGRNGEFIGGTRTESRNLYE